MAGCRPPALGYLMVELPDLVIAESATGVLGRLRSVGMMVVITHPERNPVMQGKIDMLRKWVEDGCMLQVTGQSLLGRFGLEAERCASALMKQDLVHFIASDAHDCQYRPPRLDESRRHIAKRYGVERADRLCTINPGKVLAGEPLESAVVQERKWYRFWE